MSEPTPPSTPPEPATIEYWHPIGPQPMHRVLLALCLFAGMAVGAIPVVVLGVCVFLGPMDFEKPSDPRVAGLIAVIAGLLAVTALTWLVVILRRGFRDPLEVRRRGLRFFGIGLLIGCGLAFLLEGICFTAGAIRS